MTSKEDFVASLFRQYGFKLPETPPKNWVRYCSSKTLEDPRWNLVAGNIESWGIQQKAATKFSHVSYPNVSDEFQQVVSTCADTLDAMVDAKRDMAHDFFSIQTLKRSYLIRSVKGDIIETPQYMWLRVAIGIHGYDMELVQTTYNYLSQQDFTFATPTLFNSGTINPQMSSCFLLAMKDDSIKGIFDTVADCAQISKFAGGIGMHVHNIRASGAHIHGTNGTSNGIVPMLKVFNATARYVDQGGGKRKGSIAIYIAPWHMDIEDFLRLKKNTGDENLRTRDLFPALWVSDLFMERVEANADWTLFCPSETNDLNQLVGNAFKERFEQYELDQTIRKKTIKARTVWNLILESQVETGTPYVLFKDACNQKSNQKNMGTIQSSNLCTEIVEYSDSEETAVCNLASICLPRYVTHDGFDFNRLLGVVKHVTICMNKIIDKNKYPTGEAMSSNFKARPIGIGVQGLSDVFQMMELPYDSVDAMELDAKIFETIYLGAMTASADLAVRDGAYKTFAGSPASEGVLQFDMWDTTKTKTKLCYPKQWRNLKEKIRITGLRNSLVTAVMPTASTSQIQCNTEEVVVAHSNLYSRRTLAGNFLVVNRILVFKLMQRGLWTKTMQQQLLKHRGSVQDIPEVPKDLKEVFRTIWETRMKTFIDHAAARAPFIDQSQSMSLYFAEPDDRKISSALFYGWRLGLKTGCYYLRVKPAGDAASPTAACEVCSA